jgi:hypothetical protein
MLEQRDTVEVTVAVLQPFPYVFEIVGGQPRPGAPWEELPKTAVSAPTADSLASVLRRACDVLGVRLTDELLKMERQYAQDEGLPAPEDDVVDRLVWVAFRAPGDDDLLEDGDYPLLRRDTRTSTTSVLIVHDDLGRAVWRRPPFAATIAEIMDAS